MPEGGWFCGKKRERSCHRKLKFGRLAYVCAFEKAKGDEGKKGSRSGKKGNSRAGGGGTYQPCQRQQKNAKFFARSRQPMLRQNLEGTNGELLPREADVKRSRPEGAGQGIDVLMIEQRS